MKPRIYVSHSIRGKFGKDAMREQMVENCQKAIRFGKYLRECFPEVDWYVPGDHEFPPVSYFIRKKYVTIEQVLDIDTEIIGEENCKGILFYMPDSYLSPGMLVEKNFGETHNKLLFRAQACFGDNGLPTLSGYQLIAEFVQEVERLCEQD